MGKTNSCILLFGNRSEMLESKALLVQLFLKL